MPLGAITLDTTCTLPVAARAAQRRSSGPLDPLARQADWCHQHLLYSRNPPAKYEPSCVVLGDPQGACE